MKSEIGRRKDTEIIRRVLAGDTDSFAGMIERYEDHVFRIVFRHVPPDEAAEVAHDVFVEAFRSLANYTPDAPFSNWLARISIRRCHDYWRMFHHRKEIPISQIGDDQQRRLQQGGALATDGGRRAGFDERFDQRELLDHVLNRLGPDDRMVLVLVHLEERSIEETAQLLGWTRSKVKVRAHRARKHLRGQLEALVIRKEL